MFDRLRHPARGRRGGMNGAPTTIAQDDGTLMQGKGKQFVPHGRKVVMEFPGGAGYGALGDRDPAAIRRDLALGYITQAGARSLYGMDEAEIAQVMAQARLGETD